MVPDDAMPGRFEAVMLLCDHAQSVGGKLFVLGGGWTQAHSAQIPSMALAVHLRIPWDQTNRRHQIQATLLTSEGEPFEFSEGPLTAQGEFEVGRPPGTSPGSDLDINFAMNFGPVDLRAPGGFVWQLKVNDDVVARAPFRVASGPGLFST
jgi:hypothetical protein